MKLNFAKVESHFKKSDFYEKLLEEIKDIVFTFVISNNNNYDVLLVNDAIFEIFELPSKKISQDIAKCIYDRIFVI